MMNGQTFIPISEDECQLRKSKAGWLSGSNSKLEVYAHILFESTTGAGDFYRPSRWIAGASQGWQEGDVVLDDFAHDVSFPVLRTHRRGGSAFCITPFFEAHLKASGSRFSLCG